MQEGITKESETISIMTKLKFESDLMLIMGRKRGNSETQIDWVKKYATIVSGIVDGTNNDKIDSENRERNEKIRNLIRNGGEDYNIALDKVRTILEPYNIESFKEAA